MKNQDKEFQARSLDEAISAACAYFDLPREKLEIDIVSDAKAGIFGLVGTKKARVIARPAPSVESFSMSLQMSKDNAGENKPGREGVRSSRDRAPRQERGVDRDERRDSPSSEVLADAAESAASKDKTQETAKEALREAHSARSAEQTAGPFDEDDPEDNRGNRLSDDSGRLANKQGARPERRERSDRTVRGGTRGDREHGRARRDERVATESARGDTENDASRHETPPRDRRRADSRDPRDRREGDRRERRGASQRPDRAPREDARRGGSFTNTTKLEKDIEGEDLDSDQHMAYEGLPEVRLSELDAEKLTTATREVMDQMLRQLCPEAKVSISIGDERVDVSVECEDAAALLIGREGQTLASMQYLLTRIVGRSMGAAVNMHLDIGAYRRRQDDKLRELAKLLADRARSSGRTQFTRPLSSYHRRIVHMTLQEETDLITRSKGEGPLKRVSVTLRNENTFDEQSREARNPRRENTPDREENRLNATPYTSDASSQAIIP